RRGAPWSSLGSPPVFVRQQLGDRHHRSRFVARYDDAGLGIVVENQFAAGAARPHHGDALILLLRIGMAHRDDGIDAGIAEIHESAAERHRLGAHRHATEIGIEIDAGEDFPRARAQRGADLLPVVAVALLDRVRGGGNQFPILVVQSHGPYFTPSAALRAKRRIKSQHTLAATSAAMSVNNILLRPLNCSTGPKTSRADTPMKSTVAITAAALTASALGGRWIIQSETKMPASRAIGQPMK